MVDEDTKRRLDDLRVDDFGRLLTLAATRHADRTRALLGVQGHGLTTGQVAFLPHVELGGSRLTDLAARAGMTKQSASEMVSELVRRGYLERTPDPDDRRAQRVAFTARGLAFLDAATLARRQVDRELRELLGPDVTTALTIALRVYAQPA